MHRDDNPELATLLGLEKLDPRQFLLDMPELSEYAEVLKNMPASNVQQFVEDHFSEFYNAVNEKVSVKTLNFVRENIFPSVKNSKTGKYGFHGHFDFQG